MSVTEQTRKVEFGFLRLNQVLKLIPVGKVTWWNGCKTGVYPRPYKLGPRITAWRTNDIIRCMEEFKPLEYFD